jgi:hypothetical protein
MNAVMHKYEMTEGADMPANEDNNLGLQVAVLRADMGHIQSDVTDIKADLRAFRKETGERFDKIDQRFESSRGETTQRFDKVDQKFDQKFDSIMKEIGEIKDILASAKIWALGLYFALAGSLLYVLARALKWL